MSSRTDIAASLMATARIPHGDGWRDVWDILREALAPMGSDLRDARCALQRCLGLSWSVADDVLTVAIGISPGAPLVMLGDLDCPRARRDAACASALRAALADADKLRADVLALAMEGLPYGA